MATIRGVLIAVAAVFITLAFALAQFVFMRLSPRHVGILPRAYHVTCLRLLGIKLDIEGRLAEGPSLIVANHASWLDILVIGAIGEVTFIAKQEVAGWPVFGWLARLQRSVFVDRERRTRTGAAKGAIERRLEAGERMVLFAEGTSSDGNRVLPFRTALFSAAGFRTADGSQVPVQPLSLAYTRLHGLPMGRFYRPTFAWYGDMSMLVHMWGIMRAGPADVKIVLHQPVTLDDIGDRKALASHCEARVRAGVLTALLGRPVRPEQAGRVVPA